MKILSFDVGIKNLAYCLIDSEDGSIKDWGILNISVDPVCDHQMKHRPCDKTAKKMIKDTGFKLCTSHCKIKQYKENFLEVDIVVIENQPALKNPTMKSVQMILYSYFLIEGVTTLKTIQDIQMMNARNKLKAYTGPTIKCDIKDKYKKNKFLAIEYCDYMIQNNPHIDTKYHKLYDESKKKDDLSDAYLQGIFYIQKH